jgi:RND superfamily putative drug exporter
MDYEVFLLTRVKEGYDLTGRNDEAVADGLAVSATTITSAALVMILVFGAFAFTKVFVVQVLGFGLAAAVLLDLPYFPPFSSGPLLGWLGFRDSSS